MQSPSKGRVASGDGYHDHESRLVGKAEISSAARQISAARNVGSQYSVLEAGRLNEAQAVGPDVDTLPCTAYKRMSKNDPV